MSGYKFKNIAKLKRNREIEGVTGTPVHFKKVGVTFQVLAATDANPRWRQFGDDYLNEYRRLQRAGADEERITRFLAENITRLFVIGWPQPPLHEDDTPVPFSTEACVAYLVEADDVIPAILAVVGETTNYRGEAVEIVTGELKNS